MIKITNGEKIKEIFPNSHIDERSHTVWVGYEAMSFRRDWWNAEYKEPTTKNDLGVDCISRQAVLEQAYAYGNGLEPDGYCVNVEDIQALPSVTPQEPILDKIRAEIEPKCDRINSLASVLPYTAHREIQELLCEIMDLCKTESEG